MYDNTKADLISKNGRSLIAWFDSAIYTLLAFMYEIFFNVANADLFTNEMVFHFYKRVQLIIGVYMVFQLAIIIMKGIFNTDEVSGKNNNEFVKRVIVALVMLTVLTPISIPNAANEYEKQLNDNGLLFGTLYSLQRRILSNNTIGRLVLGTNDTTSNSEDNNGVNGTLTEEQKLTQSANVFTTTMLKGFVRINLVPDKFLEPVEEDQAPEVKNNNRMCTNIEDADLETYLSTESKPSEILDLVDRTCVPSTNTEKRKNLRKTIGAGLTGKRFQFSYMPLVSTFVGIIFIFLLITFTIDVAVRAIKLAVLRLIAPIPIISYMDPKGSKDSGFNSWVKTLTTTYLELFIRLATVYFVIYLIQDMIASGIRISKASGAVGVISFVLICIGLFYFAKEAPKFIQQALGLKSEPMNIFGRTFGAMAATAAIPGSFAAARKASREADLTRQAFGEKDIFGNAINPDSTLNKGKHLLAGITGGVTGLFSGAAAAGSAKDHKVQAAMDAMRKRNADAIARGTSGSTLLGRTKSSLSQTFMGEGAAASTERSINTLKSQKSALDAVKSRMSSEMVKKDWTYGEFGGSLGKTKFNYKESLAAAEEAKALKKDKVELIDSAGRKHEVSIKEWEMQKGYLLKQNEDDYIQKSIHAVFTDERGTVHNDQQDTVLVDLIKDSTMKGAPVTDRASVTTKGIDELEKQIREKERANVINKADDTHSGKK